MFIALTLLASAFTTTSSNFNKLSVSDTNKNTSLPDVTSIFGTVIVAYPTKLMFMACLPNGTLVIEKLPLLSLIVLKLDELSTDTEAPGIIVSDCLSIICPLITPL